MPNQPLPEPIPVLVRSFGPAQTQASAASRPFCRALTSDGHRCKNKVVGGLHLCFSHYRNRRPALPEPRKVSVPLLEDASAIQLVATQILQGILSNRLDPLRARVALSALRLAALTIPGLLKPVRPPQTADSETPSAALPDSVCRIGHDHQDFISADGDLSQPPLNPSCTVAESLDAVRVMLDTLEPASRCEPESEPDDPPRPHPDHDWQRCACFTCGDFRELIRQRTEDALATAAG